VKVVYFGTYDTDKPRNRILIRALREVGVEVEECHLEIWQDVPDKSQLSRLEMLGRLWKLARAYPGLLRRYKRLGPHDAIVIGYLGHFDIVMFRLFLRRPGVPVIWDVFLSLYDTVVLDRRMLSPRNPVSWLVRAWERLACRSADRLVMDTSAHGALLTRLYGIPSTRISSVPVGAEPEHFPRLPDDGRRSARTRVLFYGQFIPLHGIGTIIEAVHLARSMNIDWHIIGKGQEESRIEAMLATRPVENLRWDKWVSYDSLIESIGQADICLGIFGGSGKAGRVIPNKAFQILSSGKPLVTRDSAAMRELVDDATPGVRLVAPEDPEALLQAVTELARSNERPPKELAETFSIEAIGHAFSEAISATRAEGRAG